VRRLEVEFRERQLASFGYTTSLNACLDYLDDGLFDVLDCRKEHYGSFLDGIGGDCFRFFYSRKKRMEGTFCYPFNPLRTCAQSLGYEYEYVYGEDEEAAIKRLMDYIGGGRPVISPLVLPPPEWALAMMPSNKPPKVLDDVFSEALRKAVKRSAPISSISRTTSFASLSTCRSFPALANEWNICSGVTPALAKIDI